MPLIELIDHLGGFVSDGIENLIGENNFGTPFLPAEVLAVVKSYFERPSDEIPVGLVEIVEFVPENVLVSCKTSSASAELPSIERM